MTAIRWVSTLAMAATILSGCGGSRVSAPIAEEPPGTPREPEPLHETVFATIPTGPAVVVSIHEGIARSTDGGLSWAITHPFPAIDLITDGTRIFAATGHGVIRSSDHGLTWERASVGLPVGSFVRSISVEGGTLVAAINADDRVAVSLDLGDSWRLFDLPQPYRAFSVLVHDGVIYAGTYPGAVFRSSDGGHTWTFPQSGAFEQPVYSLAAHEDKLFAGARAPLRMMMSSDGGVNWEPRQSGLPEDRTLYSIGSRGSELFAGTAAGIYRSSDDGASWSRLPVGGQLEIGVWDSAELAGSIYAGTTGNGVHRSDDNGATWARVQDVGTKGDPVISLD